MTAWTSNAWIPAVTGTVVLNWSELVPRYTAGAVCVGERGGGGQSGTGKKRKGSAETEVRMGVVRESEQGGPLPT